MVFNKVSHVCARVFADDVVAFLRVMESILHVPVSIQIEQLAADDGRVVAVFAIQGLRVADRLCPDGAVGIVIAADRDHKELFRPDVVFESADDAVERLRIRGRGSACVSVRFSLQPYDIRVSHFIFRLAVGVSVF